MTQDPEIASANLISQKVKSRRWWKRQWVIPLIIAALAFIAFSIPPYLTLDPTKSRIPPPEGFAFYYPLLVAHVLFASAAMITCCVLIWTWFRERYPTLHRLIGRIYVFGGVIPAGVIGLIIGALSPFGAFLQVSNVLLAILWLIFTISGFRMGRQHRFIEHRRWMIRSFALTMSVISNRIWAMIMIIVFTPQLNTTFGGNELMMIQTVTGLSGWLGWVIPLLVAEWWLERDNVTRLHTRAVSVNQ